MMTLKEIADTTGVTCSTVASYAQKEGWKSNGEDTRFSGDQVKIILEAMRKEMELPNLPNCLEGVETTLTPDLQIEKVVADLSNLDCAKKTAIAGILLQQALSKMQIQYEGMKPKAEFFDQVDPFRDALQMRDVAAALNLSGWGCNRLFKLLRRKGVLDGHNVPYREYQDKGFFRVIEQQWSDAEGETHISLKTLVYQPGVDFIRRIVNEEK
jgi:phage antirepressor YoqD-like protein